jgi:hypothetical protein
MEEMNNNLRRLLEEKRETIVAGWFTELLAGFPVATAKVLAGQGNQFANPMGHHFKSGLVGIFDQLLKGGTREEIFPWLDQIIRIRAVQELSPSQAIAFIYRLKYVTRNQLAGVVGKEGISAEELQQYEANVDNLALLAFDCYLNCREQLYQIRGKRN